MNNIIEDGMDVVHDLEILGEIDSLALLRLADMADVVAIMAAEMTRLTTGERWVLLASTYELGMQVLHTLCPWANPDRDVLIITPGHTERLRGMVLKPFQIHERMDPDLPWFSSEERSFIDTRVRR